MLYPTAPRPSMTFPDDPGSVDGFNSIISIFESIPLSLYNWLCTPNPNFHDMDAIPHCYWNLSKVSLFPDGALQSQLVNISITQQWLRTFLWQVALKFHPALSTPLPLSAPLEAAKSVMTTITSVSQRSMEVHGIGMVR